MQASPQPRDFSDEAMDTLQEHSLIQEKNIYINTINEIPKREKEMRKNKRREREKERLEGKKKRRKKSIHKNSMLTCSKTNMLRSLGLPQGANKADKRVHFF